MGGFSTAPPRSLVRPVTGDLFGPERVNVADQRSDPDSLGWFLRRLIRQRRENPEIGSSSVEVLDQPVQPVLAHLCRAEGLDHARLAQLQPGLAPGAADA